MLNSIFSFNRFRLVVTIYSAQTVYMGANQSSEPKKKHLSQVIDYVAANFITKQNFQDMVNLSDMKYCNDLVVITADVIAKSLSDMDIKYLAQRLKDGVEINEMTKEKVIFLDRNKLDDLDITNATQKRRVCIGIARFYVKVAHLFAAITTTVNPTYVFNDAAGQRTSVNLLDKSDIPEGAKTSLRRINICSQRINALLNNNDYDVGKDVAVSVGPSFCNINYDRSKGTDKKLSGEPGIPELEKLYYDEYDYDKGGFTGMTPATRKNVYEKDVETFYRAFTGNEKIPVDADGSKKIRRFSDISLRDFHKSKGCAPGGVYTKSYKGTLSDKLFSNYANHVRQMIVTAEKNQDKLLKIIDKLFVYSIHPKTKSRQIVINPALTEKDLQVLVEEARGIIVELYITCEDDFVKGLQMFEAIVENRIMETGESQIRALEESMEDLVASAPSNSKDVSPIDEETSGENKVEAEVMKGEQGVEEATKEGLEELEKAEDSQPTTIEPKAVPQASPQAAPQAVPQAAPEAAPNVTESKAASDQRPAAPGAFLPAVQRDISVPGGEIVP